MVQNGEWAVFPLEKESGEAPTDAINTLYTGRCTKVPQPISLRVGYKKGKCVFSLANHSWGEICKIKPKTKYFFFYLNSLEKPQHETVV